MQGEGWLLTISRNWPSILYSHPFDLSSKHLLYSPRDHPRSFFRITPFHRKALPAPRLSIRENTNVVPVRTALRELGDLLEYVGLDVLGGEYLIKPKSIHLPPLLHHSILTHRTKPRSPSPPSDQGISYQPIPPLPPSLPPTSQPPPKPVELDKTL